MLMSTKNIASPKVLEMCRPILKFIHQSKVCQFYCMVHGRGVGSNCSKESQILFFLKSEIQTSIDYLGRQARQISTWWQQLVCLMLEIIPSFLAAVSDYIQFYRAGMLGGLFGFYFSFYLALTFDELCPFIAYDPWLTHSSQQKRAFPMFIFQLVLMKTSHSFFVGRIANRTTKIAAKFLSVLTENYFLPFVFFLHWCQ